MSIDINALTIGQAKELAALLGWQTAQPRDGLSAMVGKKCIVRTYNAGVWFGEIAEKDGAEVIVKNARRLWCWYAVEGICLSAVALNGIRSAGSRISAPVPAVWLEAIELIPASEKAAHSIEEAPHAKAE